MGDGFANFSVDDLGIDSNGRLIVTNPQFGRGLDAAKRLEREKPRPKPPPTNLNCNLCNTVKGCGPLNTVKGCGSQIRE